MKPARVRHLSKSFSLVVSLALVFTTATQAGDSLEVDAPPVNFSAQIRPLLTDHCFPCHGPDEGARQAGLRLDTRSGATAVTRGGALPIVPGASVASAVMHRITHHDEKKRMPPAEEGDRLTALQIDTLRRWIDQGAPWEDHWAFLPPRIPSLPDVSKPTWVVDPIDAFVLARLDSEGMKPAPRAGKEALIRRVTLDLTGLPPTPAEIDAFLEDTSPRAYGDVVERLLASPRFGERLAPLWCDAARYADTNGYHHDDFRTMWPWRDWVIDAFNSNMPYDQFVIEQLAGDLLPEPTLDQLVASGFNRNHGISDEGGALDAEYRVEYVADRVTTTATVFLGLTMECARCHDHKFDPFTQEDYYGLYAFFNSIDEQGVPVRDPETSFAYKPFLPTPTKEQTQRIEKITRVLDELQEAQKTVEPEVYDEFAAWEEDLRDALNVQWASTELLSVESQGGADLQVQPDGSILASGPNPTKDVHVLTYRTFEKDLTLLRLDAFADPSFALGAAGRFPTNGNAVLSGIEVTAMPLDSPEGAQPVTWTWAWADHAQPNGDFDISNLLDGSGEGWAINGHKNPTDRVALFVSDEPFGFEGGTDITVTLRYESVYNQHVLGRVAVSFASGNAPQTAFPRVDRDWWLAGPFGAETADQAFETIYGPELARHIGREDVYGEKRLSFVHKPDLTDGITHALSGEKSAFYLGRTLFCSTPQSLSLSLGSDDALKVFLNGEEIFANNTRRGVAPDQDQVDISLVPGENTLVVKVVNDTGPAGFYHQSTPLGEPGPFALQPLALLPADRRSEARSADLFDHWRHTVSADYRALSDEIQHHESLRSEIEGEVPITMVMSELSEPVPTFVLTRGAYDQPDANRPVERQVPAVFGALPPQEGRNRLDLAKWITSGDNPLSSRVAVNRFWQTLFGTGLVRSQEDFGTRSDLPSHPDLLDHLAVTFVDSGWDIKHLLQRIVTSATYCQSSVTSSEDLASDPENRFLSQGPRGRLSAEMIRDQALFISGLLVEKQGGPSVKPYQPSGLWAEVAIPSSNTKEFARDTGEDLYRRSLYTFWKRSAPSPQMAAFDAPQREFCVVRRSATNTPIQALILMNDETYLEIARALAARVLEESGSEGGLDHLYRLALGRLPLAEEKTVLENTLGSFKKRFEENEEDASSLLAYGDAMVGQEIPPHELAAWTLMASCILNLHETITKP